MFRIIPAFACLGFVLIATVSCGGKPDVDNISIPNIKASADESIVLLDIVVHAGTIEGMSNIPIGWQVRIEDDANWVGRMRANSSLGQASLAGDELKRLILNVRRDKSPNAQFDVSGHATLSQPFSRRKLALTMEDFSVQQ